ncbi:SPOR domain-containing protein [Sphingomonas sp. LY29]|uniref:SPOR domain-containing protein n=1 Tax=Sphingomonas sp. LY29 TaxID=3095341 RepID=UPI002D7752BB|nr:SPOR domain-containing protein [Sphingomonas sp. LY29]WRP25403.1 SPOR domain-containing protein [Sphingomonas sp. LY29]
MALTTAGPVMAQGVYAETPGNALSRHIRVLASNPRDFTSLIGAGRAALDLGDLQAAVGFYSRAEESYPSTPAPKIGLGAAMAQMGDPRGALVYFDQALQMGAPPITLALDRGMARDLLGDPGAAQSDYRLAMVGANADEARRRIALSLAITGDRNGAIVALQPLLNRRDVAAQRIRAFVLALTGDRMGAAQAINSVMPGASARFDPFFVMLPRLSMTEKAAAVHLGLFPEDAATRLAQAGPPPPQPGFANPARSAARQQPVRVARAAPQRPAPQPRETRPAVRVERDPAVRGLDGREQRAASLIRRPAPTQQVASRPVTPPAITTAPVRMASQQPLPTPVPTYTPPATSVASLTASPPVVETAGNSTPEPLVDTAATATPTPAFSIAELNADAERLDGLEKLLATIDDSAPPPPAPRPKVESPKVKVAADNRDAREAREKRAAAAKKLAEDKKREEKLAAVKKAKAEVEKIGVAGMNWVQLAGGSNEDRMSTEYKKLSAKAGTLLKSRSGYVTMGKDYFRLLVGPFDSKSEAQEFVNKLAKEGVDGFSWTRTPAQIKIEKIGTK